MQRKPKIGQHKLKLNLNTVNTMKTNKATLNYVVNRKLIVLVWILLISIVSNAQKFYNLEKEIFFPENKEEIEGIEFSDDDPAKIIDLWVKTTIPYNTDKELKEALAELKGFSTKEYYFVESPRKEIKIVFVWAEDLPFRTNHIVVNDTIVLSSITIGVTNFIDVINSWIKRAGPAVRYRENNNLVHFNYGLERFIEYRDDLYRYLDRENQAFPNNGLLLFDRKRNADGVFDEIFYWTYITRNPDKPELISGWKTTVYSLMCLVHPNAVKLEE